MQQTVLVTGSTDGIGRQTAAELYARGYHVIIHGRNEHRANETVRNIEGTSRGGSLSAVYGDFSSLDSVRHMSRQVHEQYKHLDILINNAGIYQRGFELSQDGFEMTFAVNHLSHFLMTMLLLDLLEEAAAARIIIVSSMIHAKQIDFENLQGKRRYDAGSAYSLSKLCNILFTYKLSRKLQETSITANCLHPGVINTKLLSVAWSSMGASPREGAQTSLYLATSSEVAGVTGLYFVDMKPQKSAAVSYDKDMQDRLWRISENLVELDR
jgi:NAD(P)-dependent dehydrogenase (short-subunit alcohol dehydrogenase family)